MKADWVWLPSSPAGGVAGTTFTQALGNEGIAAADLVARELNDESHEVRWVEIEKLSELNLHPSFAASWPKVKELVLKLIGQSL